jgi:V8-like Glu-specific endopeptidase
MMNTLPRARGRLAVLATVPVLGAFLVSSSSAVASGGVAGSPSVSANALTRERAQTLAYWTPERKATAKSANVVAGSAAPSLKAANNAQVEGPPSAVVGSEPAGKSEAALTSQPALASQPVAASEPVLASQPWSYPFPDDAFAVSTKLYKTYPFALNGTIFFTNNGSDFKCSGTSVVNGHQASEVWTAGHCVANTDSGKKFDSFAEFIPAYNGNGITEKEIEPFGTFVATGYETSTEWLDNHNTTYDYGAMTLGKSSKKKTLSQAVGTDGFAWNQNENEQFVQFGYPGESPYNGTKMEENLAATAVAGPGVGSPFTGGSSGGAWNIDWAESSGAGYINGHTDYYYTAEPLTKYSPYIGTLANEVRCLGKTSEC